MLCSPNRVQVRAAEVLCKFDALFGPKLAAFISFEPSGGPRNQRTYRPYASSRGKWIEVCMLEISRGRGMVVQVCLR